MGLFFSAPKKPASVSGTSFSESNNHISSRELREQVRHDLHDKLGRTKGESVYGMLDAHLDKAKVDGPEIDTMLHHLEGNHQDNLHAQDIEHIRTVLGKHFND